MTTRFGEADGRVRVAYFDDQLLFREALVSVLEESGAIAVVHSTRHGVADLRSLLDPPVAALLVVLEAQTNDPMATIRAARHMIPDVPVCAMVGVDRLDRAREAIAAGCNGVVSTSATLSALVAALESLARGQAYVDPSLGGRLLGQSVARLAKGNGDQHAAHPLAHSAGHIAKH